MNLWGGHPPEGAASLESEHLQQAKKDPKSRKPEQPVIYIMCTVKAATEDEPR